MTTTLGVQTDPVLESEGWERRHLVGPDRAAESVELYESMGFEVLAKELSPPDMGDGCANCASVICASYVLIYTRRPDRNEPPTPETP